MKKVKAAILAKITDEVFSIEIKEKIHDNAKKTLQSLGFTQVNTRHEMHISAGRKRHPLIAL